MTRLGGDGRPHACHYPHLVNADCRLAAPKGQVVYRARNWNLKVSPALAGACVLTESVLTEGIFRGTVLIGK